MEMDETPIVIVATNGRVQICFDHTELSGAFTLRLDPEAAGVIARRLGQCAGDARRSGLVADVSDTSQVEMSVSPDDMVLFRFRAKEGTSNVYMTPDTASQCATEMLGAAECARIRRVQKETN